jgi:hypothetical protein
MTLTNTNKSEVARCGYNGLPMEPILDSVKKSIGLEVQSKRSRFKQKLDNLETKYDCSKHTLQSLQRAINERRFKAVSFLIVTILAFAVTALFSFWSNIIWPESTHQEGLIILGIVLAASTMGGILLYNSKCNSVIKKNVIVISLSVISTFISILFPFTRLVSTTEWWTLSHDIAFASIIALGILMGFTVYLINVLIVPSSIDLLNSMKVLFFNSRIFLLKAIQRFRSSRISKLSSKILAVDSDVSIRCDIVENELRHEYELAKKLGNGSHVNNKVKENSMVEFSNHN